MARTRNIAKTRSNFSPRDLVRWPARIVAGFLILSVVMVVIYRFVPPPVTLTMLFDKNGITKDWMSLEDIDPDMPRAAIAAEDAKFCQHHGFDAEAIQKAFEHNERGGRIRAAPPSASKPRKTCFSGRMAVSSARGWRHGSPC